MQQQQQMRMQQQQQQQQQSQPGMPARYGSPMTTPGAQQQAQQQQQQPQQQMGAAMGQDQSAQVNNVPILIPENTCNIQYENLLPTK